MSDLVNRLDIIEKDKDFVKKILLGNLSPAQQEAEVRRLLNPEERERYDAGIQLIKLLHRVRIDPQQRRDLDFGDAKDIPKKAGPPIKEWMQEHAGDIRVYGSFVEWLYSPEVDPPGDIDLATFKPDEHSKELARLIKQASGKGTRVQFQPINKGYRVQLKKRNKWVTAIDVHSFDLYLTMMPYGWKVKPSINIDGIPFERIGEQLFRRGVTVLNPGVGINGRGLIGPNAGAIVWREKDIGKLKAGAKVLIAELERRGNERLARGADRRLQALLAEPTRVYPAIQTPDLTEEKKRVRRVLRQQEYHAVGQTLENPEIAKKVQGKVSRAALRSVRS